MSKCEYICNYYGVPADIGRRITMSGKPGVIAKDRGNYLGVNFDSDKAGVIFNVHPTFEVEYFGMGKIRKPSRYQARYHRFLEYGDMFDTFIDYCRWDANPDREWN